MSEENKNEQGVNPIEQQAQPQQPASDSASTQPVSNGAVPDQQQEAPAYNQASSQQGSAYSMPPQPQQPPMGGQVPPQQAPGAAVPPQQTPGAAVPPQQPPRYGAPQPQPQPQPQHPLYPPAPLMQLTGGMKFAWLVVGALMGIPGIIIAWLVNVDKMPQVKSDALKFSIIGFVIWIVLGIIMCLIVGGAIASMVAGVSGMYGSYGHGYGYSEMW